MKRILFVDDEPPILEGIERMLFHMADEWDVCTATSGDSALAELEAAREDGDPPFDVIVTDMRMPGMDGAQLLREVHDRFPEVARIVLSGHAELEAAMRAVPVAHQFLTKPCTPGVLERVVERACSLQSLLDDDALRQTIGKLDALPSVPAVYAKLQRALACDETDARTVAAIVSQDPAMAAKLLQLVNSGFFSRRVAISDVSQAVVRLGFTTIKDLALSVGVFHAPRLARAKGSLSINSLQRHSVAVGSLARKLPAERDDQDDAFTAGLLHDVGKLVLATDLAEPWSEARARAEREAIPMWQAERATLGVTHASIGGYLLGLWGLPFAIVEAVSFHHEPSAAGPRERFGALDAVHVAHALLCGDELDDGRLAELGVSDRIDKWRELAETITREASGDAV